MQLTQQYNSLPRWHQPREEQQPTVLTRPHLGHLDALLLLAGGCSELAAVVIGEAIGATNLGRGLLLTAGTHALPTHTRAAKGAHCAAAGLCKDTSKKFHLLSFQLLGVAPHYSFLPILGRIPVHCSALEHQTSWTGFMRLNALLLLKCHLF